MFQPVQGLQTEQSEWSEWPNCMGSLTIHPIQFHHSDHSVLAPVQVGTSHIYNIFKI